MIVNSIQQPTAALSPEQEIQKIAAEVLQLAVSHKQAGQVQEAEKLYLSILDILPNHPDANYHLGLLKLQERHPSFGLPYLEAALAASPEQEQYWLAYIDALIHDDQLETAQQVLELGRQHGLQGDAVENLASRLIAQPPAIAPLQAKSPPIVKKSLPASQPSDIRERMPWLKKSVKASHEKRPATAPHSRQVAAVIALHKKNRFTEMEALARSLTLRFPQHGFGWKALGVALRKQMKNEEALAPMQRAAELFPDDAETQSNLGGFLQVMGRLSEAEICLRKTLALNPAYAHAHDTLGAILQAQGKHSEAEISLREALALNPDSAPALNNMARSFENQGLVTEAKELYSRALEVQPDNAQIHSNFLYFLSHIETNDTEALFAKHCRFGEQFEAPLRALWPVHGNSRDPERCLQIGFVSGDFRNHAVTSFIEPVLVHLAGYKTLSLHAYYNYATEDNVTRRLRGYFSHWNSVFQINDADMEEKIRADGIDILIDLSGHTAENRLPLFARKPAPVQASWIGYPGTTGIRAMDYFLTDRFLLPPKQFDHLFTEKLAYLPAGAPFLPSQDAPPVNLLPALANGYVTFGSFNRPSKLNPTVIGLWSQLLRALPDARMLLAGMAENGNNEQLVGWFAQEGIIRERLSFHPRSGMQAYLALHQQVDVCLDTFPYTGGTTTLPALWMGVPTLTLAGATAAGRQGAAILGHIGLKNLIAGDATDFMQKGLLVASNMTSLANLRTGLRESFEQSPMGRPEIIADGLVRALRTMWQRWCSGQAVASFEVLPQDRNNLTPRVPT